MAKALRKNGFNAAARIIRPVLILGVGAAVAFAVAGITFAGIQRNTAPAIVLQWFDDDAGAQARLAEQLISLGASGDAKRQDAERLATAALLRDPTQTDAARTLGILAAVQGRLNRAERLLSYAETLSRRDVPTQLWFIEHKVKLGDVEGILAHYDTVLRTSPTGQDVLFPILVQAVDEPVVYEALRDRLAGDPPWARDFLTELLANKGNPEHMAGLALTVLDGSQSDDERMRQRLVFLLVDRGEYDVAYRTYASLAGATVAELAIRNGEFERAPRYPPIDWYLAEEPDLAALPQAVPGRDGVAVRFYSGAGKGGVLARQLLRLPGGGYRFSAVVANIPPDRRERPSLELRCADKGQAVFLATVDFPMAEAEGRPWQFDFQVPSARCNYQWLTIRGRGTLKTPRDVPWMDHLTINAVG